MPPINRRGFLGLAGAAGTGLILAGCAGQTSPQPGKAAATIHAASPKTARGKVSYWDTFTGADERKGFESVTSAFQNTYPGINLRAESTPMADFMTKFTTAVQSSSTPDSLMVGLANINDMEAMNGLVDIEQSVSAWKGNQDIDPKLIAPFQKAGKTYALPCLLFVDWFYYRADWLKEAGISKPPATWTEFREVAKELTDPSKDRYGFGMRGGAGGGEQMIKMIVAFNGPLTDKAGKPALKKAAVVTALQQYTGMYLVDKSVPPSAPADGYNQIFQSFLTGRTGMLMHHTGSLQSVTAVLKPGDEVMTAVMPKAKFEMGWTQPLGNGLGSKSGQENSLAWIQYWASAPAQLKFLDATGYFPSSKKAQQDKHITDNPMFKAALHQVEVGTTPNLFTGFPNWQTNTVLVQMQAVMVGKQNADKAADVIVNDFESLFGSK